VLLDTFHPILNIVEGLFIRYIENNRDALGFTVETMRDIFVSFLAGCIPDFCNDGCFRTWRGELFCFVVKTDGNSDIYDEFLFCIGIYQCSFPNVASTKHYNVDFDRLLLG